MAPPIPILHDEAGLVVADKPPGVETAGRTIDDPSGLSQILARQLGAKRLWAVHQLDRDTSGVNLFVRKRSLVAVWQERLKPPSARKLYLALCHGRFSENARIDAPMAYDDRGRRWCVDRERGKRALTEVRAIAHGRSASLLEVELFTGRTHQVRVHLAHAGHPLIGERRYREPPCEMHPRHALHAWRIELRGSSFTAPLPADLRELAERVGIDVPGGL